MTMHQIIREKRLAKGLTQEQLATALGVTAPAVNKWEKGASCPDIALLPVLARLLDTDINALFDYAHQPTRAQIGQMAQDIVELAQGQGITQALRQAKAFMGQYPGSHQLALNLGLTLEGMALGEGGDEIEALYRQAALGEGMVRAQAQAMLAAKHMDRGEYDEARRLLDEMPDAGPMDKTQLQIKLLVVQSREEEAAVVAEGYLLSLLSSAQGALYTLLGIALKQARPADAKAIAQVCGHMVELFDLWPGGKYSAQLQLAFAQQDQQASLDALEQFLLSLKEGWSAAGSPLYRHLPQKESAQRVGAMVGKKMLDDLRDEDNHAYDFLRGNPAFAALLAREARD